MFPDKKYQIIYADPPWSFKTFSNKGKGRSPEKHYACMSLEDICKLPVYDLADTNCILFLWATFPMLEKCLEVMRCWGFEYKALGFCWVKRNKKSTGSWFWGLGYYTRQNAEVCLIGTKGGVKRVSKSVHSIVESPIQKHSEKPAEVRERIVQLFGNLPRIELFARQRAEGWEAWGDEIDGGPE